MVLLGYWSPIRGGEARPALELPVDIDSDGTHHTATSETRIALGPLALYMSTQPHHDDGAEESPRPAGST